TPELPPTSVAVATASKVPGALGVYVAAPEPSSATAAPLTVSAVVAIALSPVAVTWSATGAPTATTPGVAASVTTGGFCERVITRTVTDAGGAGPSGSEATSWTV